MAEDVGSLVARVIADTEGFRSEMTRLARTVESNTSKMNASLSKIGKASDALSGSFRIITRVAAAFGVALSARALFNFTTQSINAAAELQNLSVRLNASVESLSELQYVARLTDVDFQSFTNSLQIMTRNFGEAISGSKSMQEMFRLLGIDFRVLSTLPVDVQLETVAEALSRVENESERAARAQEIFGRSGTQMLQSLEGGAEGLRKMRQEARDVGAVLSGDTARAADEAKNAMDKLAASVKTLFQETVIHLAPALTTIAEKLREAFFPTTAEAAASAARKELEDRARLLREASAELAVYQRLAANDNLREGTGDFERFDELTRRVGVLKSEVFDAQVSLEALLSSAGSSGGGPSVIPGLGAPGAPGDLQEISVAAERVEVMRNMERELTEIKKEEEAKRFATFMEFQNLQRDSRVMLDTARLEHDTEIGSLLTEQLRVQLDERLLIEQELTTAIEDHERIRLEAHKEAADRGIQATKEALQQELQWRELVANSSIGLLQALGAKHRGAAIAALAIQKVLALAEIKIQTEVAATRALAELGPIAGPPVAAAIGIRGAISMGLVAATGLVEAAQLSSGGVQSTLGTSANPIATRSTSPVGALTGSGRTQRVTEIHLHGDIYGWDDYVERRIIDGIKSAVNDREVVIINADSRQGELLGSRA